MTSPLITPLSREQMDRINALLAQAAKLREQSDRLRAASAQITARVKMILAMQARASNLQPPPQPPAEPTANS